jgi:hypothetical protein
MKMENSKEKSLADLLDKWKVQKMTVLVVVATVDK